MKRKGFTLVELLAVIVILGIILAIAIPSIIDIISNTKRNSFKSDAKLVINNIHNKELADDTFNPTTVTESNIESLLGISNENYSDLIVTVTNGTISVSIVGTGKWDGLTACGTYQTMVVSEGATCSSITSTYSGPGYIESKGVNGPALATGMTPIKWNGTAWVNTTADDPDWYSYDTTNKQWANAKTADGSFWVWIPRYIYRISSGWHANTIGVIAVQFSKDANDNWNSAVIGNIDTGTTSNASNNKWTNQPAFTFGSTELTGFWVAKFEPTAAEGVANGYMGDGTCPINGDDVTNKTIKILPNATSWRCIQTGNAFIESRNMETNSVYGWGTSGIGIDTHLIKNIEWGAVAYLAVSNYGQDGTSETWINPANNFTTGCAGDEPLSTSTTGCLRTYDTTNGQKASTTGTIYGVYDMAGGANEKTSAYLNNGNSNLNTYGSAIISAAAQYKDVYTVGGTDDKPTNYGLTINLKGDASYESSSAETGMSGWHMGLISMPSNAGTWFIRGASFNMASTVSIFSFVGTSGAPQSFSSFRPVLAVNAGL